MRIKLNADARRRLGASVHHMFIEEFDRDLSEFQLDRIIDFFVRELGPPVYNQAIRDARAFFQAKLEDLDGEIYEPEE
jgi:uncharacterized protein (DUF2164 family)